MDDLHTGTENGSSQVACRDCGRFHVMGCDQCGADLDTRDHFDDCPGK